MKPSKYKPQMGSNLPTQPHMPRERRKGLYASHSLMLDSSEPRWWGVDDNTGKVYQPGVGFVGVDFGTERHTTQQGAAQKLHDDMLDAFHYAFTATYGGAKRPPEHPNCDCRPDPNVIDVEAREVFEQQLFISHKGNT